MERRKGVSFAVMAASWDVEVRRMREMSIRSTYLWMSCAHINSEEGACSLVVCQNRKGRERRAESKKKIRKYVNDIIGEAVRRATMR